MSDIVKYDTDHGEVTLTKETVRKYLVSGGGNVSDQEITMFLALCKYQQLNPFLREAYLIKYSGGSPATTIVGKDTFTKRAAKNDIYNGCEAGVIVVDDEREVINREGALVLDGEQLVGGWARGYRKDWEKPVFGSVTYKEYEGKKKTGEITKMWRTKPATMIRKVALVQMLRELFPDMFQGLYDSAEMGVDHTELSEKVIQQPKAKGETDERNITPEPEASPTESKLAGGSKKKRGRPTKTKKPETQPEAQPDAKTDEAKNSTQGKADQKTSEVEIDGIIDEKIAEQITALEKKCRAGITIMDTQKLIDKIELEAFNKELQEYIDGGKLEFLQNMYAELHTMYFERIKKAKKYKLG